MAKRIESKKSVAVAKAHIEAEEQAKVEAAVVSSPVVETPEPEPTCEMAPETPKVLIAVRTLKSGDAKLLAIARKIVGKPATVVVTLSDAVTKTKVRGMRAEFPTYADAVAQADFIARDAESRGWVAEVKKPKADRKAKQLTSAFDAVPEPAAAVELLAAKR